MKPTAQWISLWLALVFGAVLLLAFVIFPGFFPPLSPQLSATQVASFYGRHQATIRISLLIFNFCGCMLLPFFTVFPRWVTTFSLLTGAAMLPAAAAAVVRTGPLAWNGLVSFWLRIGAYSLDYPPCVGQGL